ncbi:ATP-binding protein [Microbulbifer agarilyticus]|uniref:ATP-binding protein n=1 Tax=Microbulbifer agarilyticus TaxID=260552 RepID=UPI001C96EE7C|nr:ATP-binding protein [Microbulbifer agarilyticus]MBY6189823.1 HAMP domain-containing protein [Microbulbifer agarilyticus]MBY6211129.1 HAMP domain-containing protein [Microbulbifer agarilyticus]MCA0892354.1 HAMP domain-containing protein [Microbulbifer agarilyticus]
MRSLFGRIFFGAWLTAVIMVLVAVYITHIREFGDPAQQDRWEGVELFREVTHNLRMTRRHGTEHFGHWLGQQPKEVQQRIYAIDEFGQEVLQRPIPRNMAPLFASLNYRNRETRGLVDKKPSIGFFVQRRGGETLRVVFMAGKSKEELVLRFILRSFWPILVLATLASGLACYLLARYLSKPLDNLRVATRRVAAGDLSYRVTPSLHGHGRELGELAADFDSMTAQLQESMTEQRRLIKDVSHELRSPLARLQVALAIARQKNVHALDPELDKIGKAADYLEDIIADILSLPVSGDNQRPLDDVVEINSLLAALCDELKDEAQQKHVSINLRLDDTELLVATRGSSLTAALENILRNAIKYSPSGGQATVTVTGIPAKTTAQTGNATEPGHCQIQVSDSGNGVPESELEAIFRPFYRTDEARSRESGGFGLGLAIAQRTVAQHQGSIEACNAAQGGLTVNITLPTLESGF